MLMWCHTVALASPPRDTARESVSEPAAETSRASARAFARSPLTQETRVRPASVQAAPKQALAEGHGLVRETFLRDLAWQIALDRVGFSPGVIDGRIGPKTRYATAELQRVRGLPRTGELDEATARALGVDPASAITTYRVTQADADSVDPPPAEWIQKSRKRRLGFESLDAAIAERFHCTRRLLAALNPGLSLPRLSPGDTLRVPAVATESAGFPRAESVEIDLPLKVIRVLDRDQRLVALLHCSIARDKEKRPRGGTRVVEIAVDPTYTFDPAMWPEVKGVHRKLTIPPGPRNPVGVFWIGLSLPGYGIHGTPQPELIGKTGSHGCIRLTNWDAVRLGRMVRVGTPVRFVAGEAEVALGSGSR